MKGFKIRKHVDKLEIIGRDLDEIREYLYKNGYRITFRGPNKNRVLKYTVVGEKTIKERRETP